MWTPKRVLLLMLGVVMFTTAYIVYAHFLGRVDGLPQLPDDLQTAVRLDEEPAPPVRRTPEVDRKLKLAFGEDCPEVSRAIRLDIQARGLVVAADEFTIEPDGRVKLKPFSVAIFAKDKPDLRFPEINTIRSDVAFLTFDQPIVNPQEMATRKIVGGELACQVVADSGSGSQRRGEGGVRIVNNRRSPQRDDDLTLFTPGPVYYQENLHQIWTREPVVLTDEQSKPKPTTINAIGMDVYLTTEHDAQAPPQPARSAGGARSKAAPATLVGRKKEKNETAGITGVKAVVLRSDVAMHLWVDARSGFLGAGPGSKKKDATAKDTGEAAKPAATAKPAETAAAKPAAPAQPAKAQVVIKTQGPFVYDMLTDHARFDISQHPGPHPNNVEVSRRHEPNGAWDQLICDHLELQFSRKPPVPASPPAPAAPGVDDRAVDLQIETAHAWGTQVTLTSDTEGLTALGNDMVYNALTRETTLKGNPEMIAMKDGNEIIAKELVMISAADDKTGYQARAKGPGRIKLLNRQSGTRPLGARWSDTLVSVKEGAYDVLTLTGDAVFEDQDHGQYLQADRLKVWLEPSERPTDGAPAASSAQGEEGQRHKPHHLEAVGHVLAKSPEMSIHDTDRLVVWFEDVVPQPGQQLPGTLPTAAAPGEHVAGKPARLAPPAPASAFVGPPAPDKSKKPVDLRARAVEATVQRSAVKNELKKLWCEGDVHVIQEPATPADKGTNISGETLQLLHYAEGHVLMVTGDLAEVQMEKLTILGPEINIDQKENKAWVNGVGCMKMPSDKGFQGEQLSKPVDLTVHWSRDMFFNGRYALFHGGIQAEQENARLACQTLQVFLDHPVSLKQGEKSGPPAKVQKLVCDKDVRIEDQKYQDGRRIGYQRIESPVLSLDNEDNVVTAPGPGVVRMLQPGPKNEGGTTPGTPKQGAPAEEMKLTRINYLGRMFGNNNTRTAVFYDTVELVYLASEDPNVAVDYDRLPPGAMYLRCNQLKVYSRREAGGNKSNQEMEAHGKATVRSQEFQGQADVIKYDESKEMVIFEAAEGGLATLYRVKVRGAAPEEIRGKKIYYWRRTNDFKIEGGTGITARENR